MKTTFRQIITSNLKKLTVALVVVLALAFPTPVLASVYGCGTYGGGNYNNSCSTSESTGSTTEPTPTPTPEETPSEGQTIIPSPSPTPLPTTKTGSTAKSSWTAPKIILTTGFGVLTFGGVAWLLVLLAKRRRGNWDNPTTINPE